MERLELTIDSRTGLWRVKVDGEKRYCGWGDPYLDSEFSMLLDKIGAGEDAAGLRAAFRKLGFRNRPIMLFDYPDRCVPIQGNLYYVEKGASGILQKLVDEYYPNESIPF
jgi:hypothetical protein